GSRRQTAERQVVDARVNRGGFAVTRPVGQIRGAVFGEKPVQGRPSAPRGLDFDARRGKAVARRSQKRGSLFERAALGAGPRQIDAECDRPDLHGRDGTLGALGGVIIPVPRAPPHVTPLCPTSPSPLAWHPPSCSSR